MTARQQDRSIQVPFSFGTIVVGRPELKGDYAKLSEQQQDRLQNAVLASITQLSTRLSYSSQSGSRSGSPSGSVQRSGRMIQDGDSFSGQAGEKSGSSITVPVTFTDTKDAIEQYRGQYLANGIARTVQNHADSFLYGLPPISDALIQHYREQALSDQATTQFDELDSWDMVSAGSTSRSSR